MRFPLIVVFAILAVDPPEALAARVQFTAAPGVQQAPRATPPRSVATVPHRHRHGVVVAPVPLILFPSPSLLDTPSVVAPPPPTVSPPLAALAPPAPPMPRVLQYAHGRYELRGDGLTSPYVWVWVPNPPPPPPVPAVPDPPPVTAPAPAAPRPATAESVPRSRTVLYRWIDDQNVVNWTNDWNKIPERFRSKAVRLDEGSPGS
jgi:hypothetical protein